MTVSLPIGRRATKCLVPGASAIYLFNEGSGTTLTDFSGNGHHGTLGAGAAAPTWAATGLTFDGTDDYCLIPALPDVSAFQFVFRNDAPITPATAGDYLIGYTSGGQNYTGVILGTAASSLANEVITLLSTSTNKIGWLDAAGVIPTGWHVLTLTFDGTVWALSLDGVHLPLTAVGSHTTVTAPTDVHVGSSSTGSKPLAGGMGPVALRPSGLTADQVDADERALAGIMATRSATITLTQTPIVLFEFDDGKSSTYDNAYPALTAAGVKGTAYVITDRIDDAEEDAMSTAELAALYAAGWDIGAHGYTHDFSLSGATEAAQTTEIGDCRDDLLTRGFTRSANHYSYRGGGHDATTLAVMATLGMKTGRTVASTTANRFDPVFYEMNGCKSLDQNLTLAAAEAHVDALVPGQIVQFYGHLIDDSAAELSWTAADLQALATYVRSKGITPLTISELYTLLGGP